MHLRCVCYLHLFQINFSFNYKIRQDTEESGETSGFRLGMTTEIFGLCALSLIDKVVKDVSG